MKLSLFWRLYLAIACSILVVSVLTLALSIAWLQRDGHADFLDDARVGPWLFEELRQDNEPPLTTVQKVFDSQPREHRRKVEYFSDRNTAEQRMYTLQLRYGDPEQGEHRNNQNAACDCQI